MTEPSALGIGVDVGGTKIEAIALDGRGRELARRCARGRRVVAVPGVELCDRDHISAAAS